MSKLWNIIKKGNHFYDIKVWQSIYKYYYFIVSKNNLEENC